MHPNAKYHENQRYQENNKKERKSILDQRGQVNTN